MAIVIKSSTRINSSTRVGGSSSPAPAAGILALWGITESNGVTLTGSGTTYTVPAGTDATITGPLTIDDGVILAIDDTASLTIV